MLLGEFIGSEDFYEYLTLYLFMQARGECFGRITIEAMAFQLPVLVRLLK